jgi:hypothetical protein
LSLFEGLAFLPPWEKGSSGYVLASGSGCIIVSRPPGNISNVHRTFFCSKLQLLTNSIEALVIVSVRIKGVKIARSVIKSGEYSILSFSVSPNSYDEIFELEFDIQYCSEEHTSVTVTSAAVYYADVSLESDREYVKIASQVVRDNFNNIVGNCWENAPRLVTKICEKIKNRTPYSVVRLGDGEGRILGYPSMFSDFDMLNEVLLYMYGETSVDMLKSRYANSFLENSILELRSLLESGLSTADVVCIPSEKQINTQFDQLTRNGVIGACCAIMYSLKHTLLLRSENVFDTFIFRGIHLQSGFRQILDGIDYCAIVSHKSPANELQRVFHIKHCEFFEVPSHASFGVVIEPHFPDAYIKTLNSIKVPFRGALFLVAAGHLGKYYCSEIKRRGGIGIDIGSVMDGWLGEGRADIKDDIAMRLVK